MDDQFVFLMKCSFSSAFEILQSRFPNHKYRMKGGKIQRRYKTYWKTMCLDHGKQRIRSTCKECGGSQFCEHQRRRSTCKECGGSQICEHQRIRACCKKCGSYQRSWKLKSRS